jgi:hypothetical protein
MGDESQMLRMTLRLADCLDFVGSYAKPLAPVGPDVCDVAKPASRVRNWDVTHLQFVAGVSKKACGQILARLVKRPNGANALTECDGGDHRMYGSHHIVASWWHSPQI